MENGVEGANAVTTTTRIVEGAQSSSREVVESTEIKVKTSVKSEKSGIRIVGARLLSESGKVESVAEDLPSGTPPSSESVPSSSSVSQSMCHTATLPSNSSQTVVVKSESSHVSSSTLTTEPVLLSTEEAPPITDGSSETPAAISESTESKKVENVQELSVTEVEKCEVTTDQDSAETQRSSVKEEEDIVQEKREEEVQEIEEEKLEELKEPSPAKEEEPKREEEPQEPMETVEEAPSVQEKEETKVEKEEQMEEERPVAETQKEEKGSSQIKEENIKNQLHEIINEIDNEVGNEEDAAHHHTWQPKGNYEIQKTEVTYEDVVPCEVPDVKLSEKKAAQKAALQSGQGQQGNLEQGQQNELRHDLPIDTQKMLRQTVINGEPISPMEIPVGIPLLAKILPKEESGDEEQREKIPLERLFTPATDVEEIIPQKKKAYASSCFYRPDHPTIDDQVELAHKISVSLVDENNKSSKGQNMYMKRKNRSSKWIHQASQFDQDEPEEEKKPGPEKPSLKLVLSPKGAQDFSAVQKHYEELMSSTTEATQHITRMEVGKEIATNLESPTGKGAALFAKRKKRMDKFIVDETSVQQQQSSSSFHEESSSMTNSVVSSQTAQESFSQIMKNGPTLAEPSPIAIPEGGAIYTAEVKVIQKPSLPTPTLPDLSGTLLSSALDSSLEMTSSNALHSLVDQLTTTKEEEKRKSFNLAPKGWGTYSNFYTPVHLGV